MGTEVNKEEKHLEKKRLVDAFRIHSGVWALGFSCSWRCCQLLPPFASVSFIDDAERVMTLERLEELENVTVSFCWDGGV